MSYQFTNVSGATVTQHVPGYNNDVWAIGETRSVPDSLLPFFRSAVGVFSESAGGGGGAVSSVAGRTGAVVLAAADIGGLGVGLSLPPGWNTNIKAALAGASGANAKIAVVGDSIACGFLSSNIQTKGWVDLMRIALQATYGNGGSGYISSAKSTVAIADATYTGAGVGGVVATTGTWTMSVADGPGASSIRGESLNATSTWLVNGTSVKVYYLGGSGGVVYGTFTVTIDGVLVDTVNSANASSAVLSKTYAVSAGAHTVLITCTTSAGAGMLNAIICGVWGRNATGVIVDNYSHGNWPSTAMANTTANTWGTTSNGSGSLQGTFGKAGQLSGGSLNPADLVITAFGVNDCRSVASGYGITPDQFSKNILLYLSDVRETSPNCDILIVVNHVGTAIEDQTLLYYHQYLNRLQGIAQSYGAGLVDIWTLLRNSYAGGTAAGFFGNHANPGVVGSDNVHPCDAGHAFIEAKILAAITG